MSVSLPRRIPFLALLLPLALAAVAFPARAEERAFVDVYTPYLEPAGETELALWSEASQGQEGVSGSAWRNRIEIEHGLSDRLTGALYLNWRQDGSLAASPRFEGPSLEAIWRLGRPGVGAMGGALYLEARTTGDETELEPRVILARRGAHTVAALNAVGEFEFRKAGEGGEAGESEADRQVALAAGVSRRLGRRLNLGLEGRLSQLLADGSCDPRALFLGPTVAVSAAGLRWALAWQPQVAGSPAAGTGLDLGDFPRARYRLSVGADL